jgi:hypothetical protein
MTNNIETNEIKQVGVKPAQDQESIRIYSRIPDSGLQVAYTTTISNATTVIYTVPVGNTLRLTSFACGCSNNSGGSTNGWVQWYNTTPAAWYKMLDTYLLDQTCFGLTHVFNPPLEIPQSYYLQVYSGSAGHFTWVSFHGFL